MPFRLKSVYPYTMLCTCLWVAGVALFISGCQNPLNNPYRDDENKAAVYYATFYEQPKTLDPARSYSADEYRIICQIYEPPLQYNYLKRPFQLEPLTAAVIPQPRTCAITDAPARGADSHSNNCICYDISIKQHIYFQPHPCFARDTNGQLLYHSLSSEDVKNIDDISDFKQTGSRELKAEDYIYQIYRLADPRNNSPIAPLMSKYLLGFNELSQSIAVALDQERTARRIKHGATYNQQTDEMEHPIHLDYRSFSFAGAVLKDDFSFSLVLKTPYPQILYWLAMPFFSPIPWEAEQFYNQGPLLKKNITLQSYPVGTGPFRMKTYDPNLEIVLSKNEHFHHETYPTLGEEEDGPAGYLNDASKPLPFLDKIIFKLERESIPRWNKFLQGYYDASGLTSDSFDQAITFSAEGLIELTEQFKSKKIMLLSSIMPSTFYYAFNMNDPLVGGYTNNKQLLRQAIAIAIDIEEQIELFANGRGIPAHGPIPPGIFGYETGPAGLNPYVYRWNDLSARPERRSIAEARQLLAASGYPNGRDPASGKPLIISFDNAWTGPESQAQLKWLQKQFQKLGIVLESRTSDYNRFQEKIRGGNFQFFSWGWHADYPDPENFLFLLYGPNGKQNYGGENAANYNNPDFNQLFKKMETMHDIPERGEVIRTMLEIVRRDTPWVWGYHPTELNLNHQWVFNVKPHAIAQNTFKYIRIDPELRYAKRLEWNKPVLWPVITFFASLLLGCVPAYRKIKRSQRQPRRLSAIPDKGSSLL